MKGVYAVFFEIDKKNVDIGALGSVKFDSGTYVYIGSAMNGVEERVKRHYSEDKNNHWHIDYFSQEASPVYSLAFQKDSDFECELAQTVAEENSPVPNFGASDCNCESHLFRVGDKGILNAEL